MPGDRAATARLAPRVTGQLESSLYMSDLERSRALYEKVLGFEALPQEPRMVGLAVLGTRWR